MTDPNTVANATPETHCPSGLLLRPWHTVELTAPLLARVADALDAAAGEPLNWTDNELRTATANLLRAVEVLDACPPGRRQ